MRFLRRRARRLRARRHRLFATTMMSAIRSTVSPGWCVEACPGRQRVNQHDVQSGRTNGKIVIAAVPQNEIGLARAGRRFPRNPHLRTPRCPRRGAVRTPRAPRWCNERRRDRSAWQTAGRAGARDRRTASDAGSPPHAAACCAACAKGSARSATCRSRCAGGYRDDGTADSSMVRSGPSRAKSAPAAKRARGKVHHVRVRYVAVGKHHQFRVLVMAKRFEIRVRHIGIPCG